MATTNKTGSSGTKSKSTASKSTAAKKTGTTTRSKAAEREIKAATGSKVRDEICSIVIIAIGILLLLAIQTTTIGPVGLWLHDFFFGCFGILAYVLPYYLIIYGILLLLNKTVHITGKSFTLMVIIFCLITLINSARYIDEKNIVLSVAALRGFYLDGITKTSGGLIGMLIGSLIAKALGNVGMVIVACVGIIICLMLVMNTPLSQFIEDSKVRRIERRIAHEEELAAYEKEQEERRIERDVEERYAKMTREKEARAKGKTQAAELPLEAPAPAPTQPEQLSAFEQAKRTANRKNILGYMNDDQLFGGADAPAGLDTPGTMVMGITQPTGGSKPLGDTSLADLDNTGLVHLPPEKIAGIAVSGAAETSSAASNATAGAGIAVAGGVSQTAATGTPAAEPVKKMTKSEAAGAMLTQEELDAAAAANATDKPYEFPSVELLNKSKGNTGNSESMLRQKAVKLEETLRNFHVDAKVVAVTQGPAVTRYEIQPAVGVKVSSITRLADDIALNLEAKSIRIEAPIPGKAAVGIEVENEKINVVNLRDIIESKEFKNAKSKISFSVGKDIAGNCIVGDLKSMPHLLIAGSTGSGKSVCVNSIILSILYKAKPDEVKLVLIDPKVVELGNYNGIPHLLIPVVTEPNKAAAALNWAVAEMDDRYRKFADVEVRDLESYNDYVRANQESDLVMPQVVIIIDELADLMMAAPSQVEESICRLAQKARAAGMHLIVATQRPSVDVVTGLIKANVPSRIAFAVSSQIDSRVILDKTGAEKLVGKGDMLYNPLGMGQPIRVQGTFVSDGEVHNVLEHVKKQGIETEYSSDVIHTIERANAAPEADDDGDELLPEAIETVVRAGQASVSMLQRRFRIGYNRSARIVDMMEARGIIGPADGSRPRQVLLTLEEWEEMQNATTDLE